MQTVPNGRKPILGGVWTQYYGGGADVFREEKRAVECGDCRKGMAAGLLEDYQMVQHGKVKADR